MRSGVLPRTMVYLSWGEQRPITRSDGHSAPKLSRSIDPSARSTRSRNSGPDITASLEPDALLSLRMLPAGSVPTRALSTPPQSLGPFVSPSAELSQLYQYSVRFQDMHQCEVADLGVEGTKASGDHM